MSEVLRVLQKVKMYNGTMCVMNPPTQETIYFYTAY